ncbi:MAG: hypothetical protein ABII75_09710 [Candidatus Omnitrophota bacterium]
MPLEVNDDILKKANKCLKNKKCVSSPDLMCAVKECVDGNLLFITEKESGYCNYKFNFGTDIVCGCPVRKYSYLKDGV